MGEMIDGQPLFPGESEIDQLYLIQKTLGPLTLKQQEQFSKNQKFVGLKFPEITKIETLEKRFLKTEKKVLDFMNRLLKIDPCERMTAGEALMHPYLNDNFDWPQTTCTDSANLRGRHQTNVPSKNKRGYLVSNQMADNKKNFFKDEKFLSPPPIMIKDTQCPLPLDNAWIKPVANKEKFRISPFNPDAEVNKIFIDRDKSKEGIKYNENYIELKQTRKKKSVLEDNQMFNINEEDSKFTPRGNPVSLKKKNKLIHPQDISCEGYQGKNLKVRIFNKVLPKICLETHKETDEISSHQSARQLPDIYTHI